MFIFRYMFFQKRRIARKCSVSCVSWFGVKRENHVHVGSGFVARFNLAIGRNDRPACLPASIQSYLEDTFTQTYVKVAFFRTRREMNSINHRIQRCDKSSHTRGDYQALHHADSSRRSSRDVLRARISLGTSDLVVDSMMRPACVSSGSHQLGSWRK